MSKNKLHSDDISIEQKPALVIKTPGQEARPRSDGDVEIDDPREREPEVVRADPSIIDADYQAELSFMEEPVTIRLEPSTEKNAANVFPCWCNGRGGELMVDGRWITVTYLPVGMEITTKRKYLEVIVRAKIDTIQTDVIENPGQDPENRIRRFTSPIHSFSIIEDRNPRGAAWLTELRRRNF